MIRSSQDICQPDKYGIGLFYVIGPATGEQSKKKLPLTIL